jgi:hypothetical protein
VGLCNAIIVFIYYFSTPWTRRERCGLGILAFTNTWTAQLVLAHVHM